MKVSFEVKITTVGRRFRSARALGFTLVEMLTVILIMGILLGVATSFFGRSEGEALRSSGEDFMGMVDQARTTAISRNRPVALLLINAEGEQGRDGNARMGLFELEEWQAKEPLSGKQVQKFSVLARGMGFRKGSHEELENVLDTDKITINWRDGNASSEAPGLVFSQRGSLLYPEGSNPVVVVIGSGAREGEEWVERGSAQRAFRIGRTIARPWMLEN